LYTPPSRRGDATTDIRVNGIAEDTTEDDIRRIFSKYGRIAKVHLVRDRETREMRGFGFVTFVNREDAEKGMKGLQGFGWSNIIWRLEWAQPSKNKN